MSIVSVIVAICLVGLAAVAVVVVARARAAARVARERADAETRRADEAESRRRAAFHHLPLAALRVDASNHLVEVNARALGRFPHLRPGMTMLEAFGEHRLADGVAEVLRTDAADTFEVRLFADDRRTYRVSVRPRHEQGVLEAHVFMADLTEAVAYQELRSQFVANVSHELRTPLTGLRGLVEALDDPEMDAETHARFVGRAGAEITRLEALITDILFLSELESTQGRPPDDLSDLASAATATIEQLAPAAAEHRVTLISEVAGPVWIPLSDRMARTVVRNLLENAVRYAGAGATAVVALAPGDPADPGWLEVVVRDDGVGIPERHLPHVFERFYRADPSRSKRMGGTGLGLSIVKHIAERFGGSASAESREGFGTTVRVRLPVAAPPDAAHEDADGAAAARPPVSGRPGGVGGP